MCIRDSCFVIESVIRTDDPTILELLESYRNGNVTRELADFIMSTDVLIIYQMQKDNSLKMMHCMLFQLGKMLSLF